MKWRIYYSDRDPVSGSTDEEAFWVPTIDVQATVHEELKRATGFGVVTERKVYCYKDGRFWGADEIGMYDYLFHHPGPKAILFGRTIKDDNWNTAVQRAIKEGLGV